MTEKCYECDGEAVLVHGPREVRVGTRVVTVEAEYMCCEACGEVYYLPGQMREMQRKATGVVRAEEGLLTPHDIEGVRAQYGLSQTAFERLINAGPKTVTRWERGTVAQNGTADTLMRVLRDRPDVAEDLAVQRGVVLPKSPPRQSHLSSFLGADSITARRAVIHSHRPGPVRKVAEARQLHPYGGTLQEIIHDYGAVPDFEGAPGMHVGATFRQKVGA